MSESAVSLQPAYILQHRKYRETSLIFDVLTRDYGIVPILAKGVRKKKSTTAGLLLPFVSLKLSFQGRSDLKVLTGTEAVGRHGLSGIALFCGFYVNELLCHFLHKYDPQPEVFELYEQCLKRLEDSTNVERTLRMFELRLLERIGYAVPLDCDARDGSRVIGNARYRYESGVGLVSCNEEGLVGGTTLLALHHGADLDQNALAEAKQLTRTIFDGLLQGKALNSRQVLAKIIKYLQ